MAKARQDQCKEPVTLASRNPFAGCKSYYDKPKLKGEKIYFSWQDDHDYGRSKSADQTKFLHLEKQYTRGVAGNNQNQSRFLSAPITKRGQPESARSSNRPTSPIPGASIPPNRLGDTPVYTSRSNPRECSRDAQPQEWTKQRVHENNMEWRGGYESWRGRANQIYNNMARELDISLAEHPYSFK